MLRDARRACVQVPAWLDVDARVHGFALLEAVS
jgi:hypothetical protein